MDALRRSPVRTSHFHRVRHHHRALCPNLKRRADFPQSRVKSRRHDLPHPTTARLGARSLPRTTPSECARTRNASKVDGGHRQTPFSNDEMLGAALEATPLQRATARIFATWASRRFMACELGMWFSALARQFWHGRCSSKMLSGMACNDYTVVFHTIQCLFVTAEAAVDIAGLTTFSFRRFQPTRAVVLGASVGWRKQSTLNRLEVHASSLQWLSAERLVHGHAIPRTALPLQSAPRVSRRRKEGLPGLCRVPRASCKHVRTDAQTMCAIQGASCSSSVLSRQVQSDVRTSCAIQDEPALAEWIAPPLACTVRELNSPNADGATIE